MVTFLRRLAAWAAMHHAYAWLGASGLVSAAAGVAWMRAVLVRAAVALGGCAALPGHVERAPSSTRTDVGDTALARVALASTPDDMRDLSGFRLLADGEQAFQARLALIRKAEMTLDVQYYVIANDRTGTEFLAALQQAAARGVRVRILVDDLYASGEDGLFASLAAGPNVEVRMFNPLPARGDSFAARVAFSLHEFSRINHRMHNKLFIADDSFAIFGGRNIADEYFGRAERANFIDTDVLATGPVIARLSEVFDAFWNSEHAYPIQALVSPQSAGRAGRPVVTRIAPAPAANDDGASASGRHGVAEEVEAGRIAFDRGEANVLADGPSKVLGDGMTEGAPSIGTRELLARAASSAFVSSPYLVPGAGDMASLAQARRAGVDVRIVTNSMQSTDEPLVYLGFARHAAALAALGVDVREVSVEGDAASAGRSGESRSFGASQSTLHAKLVVVDGRWSQVGSFNMDKRSALWNTELIVRVDCVALAHAIEAWAEANVPVPGARARSAASASLGAGDREPSPASASGSWWQRAAVAVVNEDFL
jgi:putative cardiolipin synthase